MELKLCKDCQHYRNGGCWHQGNLATDYVNGGMRTAHSIDYMRTTAARCGHNAQWFQLRLKAVQ